MMFDFRPFLWVAGKNNQGKMCGHNKNNHAFLYYFLENTKNQNNKGIYTTLSICDINN